MIEIFRPKKQNIFTNKKVGIFITKDGKDIKSKNPEDYNFITVPSASIKQRLSLSVTTGTSAPTSGYFEAEYKHNFNYKPEIIAFVTTAPTRQGISFFDPGNTYLPVPTSWQSGDDIIGGQRFEVFDAWADENTLHIGAIDYTVVSGVGITYFARTYTFDVLLLMEGAK